MNGWRGSRNDPPAIFGEDSTMSQQGVRHKRKLDGLCIYCGQPAKARLCDKCANLHRAANKKWRRGHRELFNGLKKRNYQKGRKNDYCSRLAWTDQDERFIVESDLTDRQLAEKIGRSVAAIQIKRSRLRSVESALEPLRNP